MLVLASASPRRRELLAQAGFTFTVHPAHIPEDPLPNEDPVACVTRLAREKAQAVYNELALKGHEFSRAESDPKRVGALAPEGSSSNLLISLGAPGPSHLGTGESTNPNLPSTTPLVVLAADTIVTLDNQILGKPSDPADAARMLRLLSGRTHHVITGVALISATSTQVAAETTAVTFLPLTGDAIAAYIATGEPMDKAGAYAIQGRAARWIPRIEGDYFNVVGLPLALVSALLESR
jgi:septum formation protein